jgi:hypothetical protein
MYQIILLAIVVLSSSCATIFNSKQRDVLIATDRPAYYIINGDTSKREQLNKYHTYTRTNTPLNLQFIADTIVKEIHIKPSLSGTSILNLGFGYFSLIGFGIDLLSKKGYKYPDIIYVEMDKSGKKFQRELPFLRLEKRHAIKVLPLRSILRFYNGIEIGYEYAFDNSFSTEIRFNKLLRNTNYQRLVGDITDISGFSVVLEPRYFFSKTGFKKFYFAGELRYFQAQHKAKLKYTIPNTLFQFNENVNVEKQSFSLAPKIGYQFEYKSLVFDFAIGLGVQFNDVTYNYSSRSRFENYAITNLLQLIHIQEGTYYNILMPANIKIGYCF